MLSCTAVIKKTARETVFLKKKSHTSFFISSIERSTNNVSYTNNNGFSREDGGTEQREKTATMWVIREELGTGSSCSPAQITETKRKETTGLALDSSCCCFVSFCQ